MNHYIDIHGAQSVHVNVAPRGDFDVLRLEILADGQYTNISLFGGRWNVAEQTIHVTSDEEIAEKVAAMEAGG